MRGDRSLGSTPLSAACRLGLCPICLTRSPNGPQGELSVFTSSSRQRSGADMEDEGELDRDESGVTLSAACRRGSPEVMRTLERNRTLRFLMVIGVDRTYGLSAWESSAADESVVELLSNDSGTWSISIWMGSVFSITIAGFERVEWAGTRKATSQGKESRVSLTIGVDKF